MEPASREFLRELARTRAHDRCEYCRLPQAFSELRFHVEHVIPRQHGGLDTADNPALACPECNSAQGSESGRPRTGSRRIVPLFHPRRERWIDHFSHERARVIGITAQGKATVALFDMNDPERLRVRSLLLEIGELE